MARAIFLGLLAANLLLFGWHIMVDERAEARVGAAIELDTPGLALADEASVETSVGSPPEEPAENGAGEGGELSRRCLSLGPFMDDRELEEAQARLSALGLEGDLRRSQGQIWVGYWIFLPPTKSRDEAVDRVEAMRKLGIGDIYIEPAGDRENAVSLGVFSDRERAQRRFREIRELGFEPQIARRNRQGTVFWLDFVPDENVSIDPADFLPASGRVIRLATRACQ